MNSTLLKSILRLIRDTIGRFMSLTAIVTIGVAFFVGVSAASPIMGYSVDKYDDETGLKDITIYSDYGFDPADVEAVRKNPYVKEAEGTYFADAVGVCGQVSVITRIHAWDPDGVTNRFVLKEGRLPEKKDEALAEAGTELEQGFPIGSEVELVIPDDDGTSALQIRKVTIVGTIDTPVYLNMTKENSTQSNQYIETYLYVPEAAFSDEYYLEMNILLKDAEAYNAFTDAYEDYAKEAAASLEELAAAQKDKRIGRIKADALKEYEDGLKEYEDGKKEFEEGISDAEKEIREGQEEIDEGEEEIRKGEEEIEKNQKLLDEETAAALRKLENASRDLRQGKAEYEKNKKEFEATKKELLAKTAEIDNGIKQIDSGIASLNEAKEGLAQIDDGLRQIREAKAQLNEAKAGIEKAMSEPLFTVNDPISVLVRFAPEVGSVISALGISEDDTIASLLDALQVQDSLWDSAQAGLERIPEEYRSVPVSSLAEELSEEEYRQLLEVLAAIGFSEDTTIDSVIQYIEENRNQSENTYPLINALLSMAKITDSTPLSLLCEADPSVRELVSAMGLTEENNVGELRRALDAQIAELDRQEKELQETRNGVISQLAANGLDGNNIDGEIASLKKQRSDLTALRKQILDGIAEGEAKLKEAWLTIQEGEKEIDEGRRKLAEETAKAQAQLDDARSQLRASKNLITKSLGELGDARKELADARKKGIKELEDAKKKLDDAKKEIDDLKPGHWTILDRTSHYASATYRNTVDQMEAIGRLFPVFFILVAALVCLTTMTRMVDEQRGELGVLRAMGYSRLQCAGKYLIYAGMATLLGEVIGVIAGLAVFPFVIYHTWRMMYILPDMRLTIPWNIIALSCFGFMGGMLLTTWFACRRDTSEVPAQLMRPKAPKLGRKTLLERIPLIWNRLTFTWKVTMRNIFRYRQRFIMTVAGVAGCTALLVTGGGIRDSINSMVDVQFYDIYQYDGSAALTEDITEKEAEKLAERLNRRDDVDHAVTVRMYSAMAASGNGIDETVSVQIFSEPEDVKQAYRLRTRRGKKPIVLDDSGVVLSEKLAENLGLSVGDPITFEGEDGRTRAVPVSAVTEMYIRHYVLISEACYEEYFGALPEQMSLLIKGNGDTQEVRALQEDLTEMAEVESIAFFDVILENFNGMVKGLDIIVWTLILSSMALAFVVLGNLINVNISERQREIATLKVLGFRKKEVENYIYKENHILTLIGAMAGLPVGTVLHHYIMRMVEMDYIMFGREVLWPSYVMAACMTFFFGILVNHAMAGKLSAIKMVESLKSVE